MDPEIKVEFSVNAGEESEMSTDACRSIHVDKVVEENTSISEEKTPPVTTSASTSSKFGSGSSLLLGEDTVSKKEDLVINKSSIGTDRGRKSSAHSNNSSGKKKVKVDWTPELHKQFVQAVEQLGVDKAVPSRILEIMGVDCLTRHNVASHLQKYRSRRKYLLARETEAATWSRRKQICGTTNRTPNMNARTVPTTGFPPVTPMPHIRPLHVWGHPSADQSLAYMWPGHVASSHSPHAWGTACYPLPQPPPGDPYFWYYHHQDIPAPGTPCFSPHFPPTRFTSLPVPGAPPSIGFSIAPNGQTLPQPSLEPHPQSKEAIDAVIGDVLSRPWLPMPIGLKPPSIDSVMLELQRQGITKVPPTCV